jgi:hypothetical protein
MQQEISTLLDTYFKGLYRGDSALLKSVFHPQAQLFGEVRGVPYFNTLDKFLVAVAGRQSPEQRGEEFRMQVLEVKLLEHIASAHVRCPMLGFDYYDYLSLLREGGRWQIVSKLFIHVDG